MDSGLRMHVQRPFTMNLPARGCFQADFLKRQMSQTKKQQGLGSHKHSPAKRCLKHKCRRLGLHQPLLRLPPELFQVKLGLSLTVVEHPQYVLIVLHSKACKPHQATQQHGGFDKCNCR